MDLETHDESDADWQDLSQSLHRLAQRLVEVGWLKSARIDPGGMATEWTVEGLEAARVLWLVLEPLAIHSMSESDLSALRRFLTLTAHASGWGQRSE